MDGVEVGQMIETLRVPERPHPSHSPSYQAITLMCTLLERQEVDGEAEGVRRTS